jgi:chromosome segregation ATPase
MRSLATGGGEEAAQVLDRAGVLEEMIGEYEYELSVARSRLDQLRLRRAKYELAREVLIEHGEAAEADRLKQQIHDLDHQISSSEILAENLEVLLETYRRSLDRLRADA